MADKKISALTPATTPLGGTEVLPIVQSGSTVKVSVADLTAGRTVTASAIGIGTSSPLTAFNVEGGNILLRGGYMDFGPTAGASGAGRISSALGGGGVNGSLIFSTINSSAVMVEAGRFDGSGNFGLGVTPSAWAAGQRSLDIGTTGALIADTASNSGLAHNAYYGAGAWTYKTTNFASLYSQTASGQHQWLIAPSGTADTAISWFQAMTLDNSGNLTANVGNVVIGTAGKGIDFSANTHAPGMTSELLNWYEEGTYIATLTPQTSGSITVNPTNNWDTLAYTRIGRVVHVQGGIRVSAVSSPSGAVALNLPFTSANLAGDAGISVGVAVAQSLGAYNQPLAMYVGEGTATAIIQFMNAGTRTSVPGSDFSGDEELQFNISYIAA